MVAGVVVISRNRWLFYLPKLSVVRLKVVLILLIFVLSGFPFHVPQVPRESVRENEDREKDEETAGWDGKLRKSSFSLQNCVAVSIC